jgi:Protein of unknown function (DUF3305)
MPTMTMQVGVVLEKRKARSQWLDVIWEARVLLAEPPDAAPGSPLGRDGDGELFYGGAATLEAHTVGTPYYRDNISTGQPRIWVVLRPPEGDGLPEIVKVTCDPTEGEGYTETGWNTVNVVPMPEPVLAALMVFIDEHHIDQPYIKRKRDRADPEALAFGAKGPERDRILRELREKEGSHEPS